MFNAKNLTFVTVSFERVAKLKHDSSKQNTTFLELFIVEIPHSRSGICEKSCQPNKWRPRKCCRMFTMHRTTSYPEKSQALQFSGMTTVKGESSGERRKAAAKEDALLEMSAFQWGKALTRSEQENVQTINHP